MKTKLQFPLIIYGLWYTIILLFQTFLEPIYRLTTESLTLYQRLFYSWATYWDSAHYISIGINGYKFPQQAFFPLWPLLIKIVSFVLSPFIATFILSFVFGLLTFILFYSLAIRLVGKDAKWALILFASFPSTFVLHAGYTEGLFLTLTLLSFLMLEKKHYFLSAIFAGLTTMTRLAGIGMIAAYIFLRQRSAEKLIYVVISLSGVLFYILFLQLKFGNGLLFIDAQKVWCQAQGRCQFVFPLIPLINYAQLLLIGWAKPSLSFVFIDWFFSVLFIILLIPVFKKLKFHYFIYSLIVIFLPLFSSTVGMVRYVLIAFPIFFVFPLLIRSKILFFIICTVLFLLELRFVALFTNRMWVA